MDSFNKNKSVLKDKTQDLYGTVKDKASETYYETQEKVDSLADQVKDTANDLYEGSKEKLTSLEACIEEYTDEMIQKVKEKPITSLLIAGGIGFIISKLLKK